MAMSSRATYRHDGHRGCRPGQRNATTTATSHAGGVAIVGGASGNRIGTDGVSVDAAGQGNVISGNMTRASGSAARPITWWRATRSAPTRRVRIPAQPSRRDP